MSINKFHTTSSGETPAGHLGEEENAEARKVGMCTGGASNVGMRNQNVLHWGATDGQLCWKITGSQLCTRKAPPEHCVWMNQKEGRQEAFLME